jgi:hypothetical protein
VTREPMRCPTCNSRLVEVERSELLIDWSGDRGRYEDEPGGKRRKRSFFEDDFD